MKDQQKRTLLIIILYIVIFGIFIFIRNKGTNIKLDNQLALSQNVEGFSEEETSVEDKKEIFVHISGEVHYPGLIKLNRGQRLFEAIDIAGGMTELADINQINLSIILNDEDKIYIPKKGENSIFLTTNIDPLININTCTKEELMTLSGIGEKTAESIIEYRNNNRFEKIEDLMKVNGIGNQKFENIKERITI